MCCLLGHPPECLTISHRNRGSPGERQKDGRGKKMDGGADGFGRHPNQPWPAKFFDSRSKTRKVAIFLPPIFLPSVGHLVCAEPRGSGFDGFAFFSVRISFPELAVVGMGSSMFDLPDGHSLAPIRLSTRFKRVWWGNWQSND